MRIDVYLCRVGRATRSKLRKMFRKTDIFLNNVFVDDLRTEVHDGDIIDRPDAGEENHRVMTEVYCVLYKPAGYVCSNVSEGGHASYRDLLEGCPMREHLSCAGRLDADTTGLVVCSTDGNFVHRLISPRTHCPKTYELCVENDITDEMIVQRETGVLLNDGYTTLPATVEKVDNCSVLLTIIEGKYHQVKRMCAAVGATFVSLHRKSIGPFTLDGLEEGGRRLETDISRIVSLIDKK